MMNCPLRGSIELGKVSRIELYGAFIDLDAYRRRGLVHISELANFKVEKVDDVVSIGDVVWVKVLNVEEENRDGKVYTKIQLTIKDVSQDGTKEDLSKQRTNIDAMRDQIAQNLNSSIGMGVAMDPMARKSQVVLKSDLSAGSSALINGYALVDYDEITTATKDPNSVANSFGRGRNATLPAWMTQERGPGKISKPKETNKAKKERKHRKREVKAERKHSKERKQKKEKKKDPKLRRRDTSVRANNDKLTSKRAREKRRSERYYRSEYGSDVASSQSDSSSCMSQSDSLSLIHAGFEDTNMPRHISLEMGHGDNSKGRGRGMTLPAWMTRQTGPIQIQRSTVANNNKKQEHRRKKRRDRSEAESTSELGQSGHRKEGRRRKHCKIEDGQREEYDPELLALERARKKNLREGAQSDEDELNFKSVEEAKRLIAKLENTTS
mmetsp:Transcript_13831/g.20384  ORF Transcript_13831/g.20384 Transcript_13831/m.20384 type:complete len:439 (+) Transcript_13831:32-1348(+)